MHYWFVWTEIYSAFGRNKQMASDRLIEPKHGSPQLIGRQSLLSITYTHLLDMHFLSQSMGQLFFTCPQFSTNLKFKSKESEYAVQWPILFFFLKIITQKMNAISNRSAKSGRVSLYCNLNEKFVCDNQVLNNNWNFLIKSFVRSYGIRK